MSRHSLPHICQVVFSLVDDLDDGDIIALFKEYKEKAEAAKQSQKLLTSDEAVLDRALGTAKNRAQMYEGNKNNMANVQTRRSTQIYDECVKSFKNFINDWGTQLNTIFCKVEISKVW